MVHGLLGYDEYRIGRWVVADYFNGVPTFLRAARNRVFVPRLSMTRGVTERAEQLCRFVVKDLAGESFHVIAHSLGGLDARHLITHIGDGRPRSDAYHDRHATPRTPAPTAASAPSAALAVGTCYACRTRRTSTDYDRLPCVQRTDARFTESALFLSHRPNR